METLYLELDGTPAVIVDDRAFVISAATGEWVEANEADVGWKGRVIPEQVFREWLARDYDGVEVPTSATGLGLSRPSSSR